MPRPVAGQQRRIRRIGRIAEVHPAVRRAAGRRYHEGAGGNAVGGPIICREKVEGQRPREISCHHRVAHRRQWRWGAQDKPVVKENPSCEGAKNGKKGTGINEGSESGVVDHSIRVGVHPIRPRRARNRKGVTRSKCHGSWVVDRRVGEGDGEREHSSGQTGSVGPTH